MLEHLCPFSLIFILEVHSITTIQNPRLLPSSDVTGVKAEKA